MRPRLQVIDEDADRYIDPDCQAGKHPACPGYTYAETPDGDLLEVPCGCDCHE